MRYDYNDQKVGTYKAKNFLSEGLELIIDYVGSP